MHSNALTLSQEEAEQRNFITRVYTWMFFGLALTGLVAMQVASSEAILRIILGTPFLFWGLIIGELILVGALAGWVRKMSAIMATGIFLLYAALNGLTFSIIFVAFTKESIALTFFVTAGTFGVMSAYGYFTKKDLTSWGNLLFMALIGFILASVANIFFRSSTLHWITTFAGILIFVGLTAYDTQKIKEMNVIGNKGTEEDQKEAISGALRLYLDFINLFLLLLRLFGRRR